MKILRIHVSGLDLFDEDLDISFYNLQRVYDEDKDYLSHLYSNIYLNTANAFIGRNASGKTTVLELIDLVLNIIKNKPINHVESKYVLNNSSKVILDLYYFDNNNVNYLQTTIVSMNDKFKILSENLWQKSIKTVRSKNDLFKFNNSHLLKTRDNAAEYLLDDVSIIVGENKKSDAQLLLNTFLSYTNIEEFKINEKDIFEIVEFLDPTIESLVLDNHEFIHLKFKGKKELLLNSPKELIRFLSSGTIKGIMIFNKAMSILKNGGYLLIDEIENHFNKEIVSTLIRLFMDSTFNINGATLIFTTHYPELLDLFDRNDAIFFVENESGIKVKNLSTLINRNDLKKSDVYEAGLVSNTAPTYEAYMKMKKKFTSEIKGTK